MPSLNAFQRFRFVHPSSARRSRVDFGGYLAQLDRNGHLHPKGLCAAVSLGTHFPRGSCQAVSSARGVSSENLGKRITAADLFADRHKKR